MSDFDLDPDADTDASLPDDAPRITAEVVEDDDGSFRVVAPDVQVEGDVPSAVVEAVRQAVEEHPNACDEPRVYGADAWSGAGRNRAASAYFVARFNETPVVGDGPEPEGWLPPYRARENIDAELDDALPQDIERQAENSNVTGFYDA